MSAREIAKEAALLLANDPSGEHLPMAERSLRELVDGIQERGGRWLVSHEARRVIGKVNPALARERLVRALAVIQQARAWLSVRVAA